MLANGEQLRRAGSAPTKVVSGKTEVRAKAAVFYARDCFTARKRASIRALMTTAKGRRRPSKDPARSTAPVGSEVIQNPALTRDCLAAEVGRYEKLACRSRFAAHLGTPWPHSCHVLFARLRHSRSSFASLANSCRAEEDL